jgi:uncharacterized protein (TIGR02391 family)
MIEGHDIPKIEGLIKKIPKDQLHVLRTLWDYFLQTKEWPKGKSFRKNQGRLIVEEVVANLSPIFINHIKNRPSEDYYALTTEGIYAIEGSDGPNIKLLLSYLDYLRKRFNEDPDFEKVTAQEVRESLGIDSEDTRILGEFFDMGNCRLWGRSASNMRSSDWEIGVIEDIEILYEANSSLEFLFKQWNDNIERIITYRPNEIPNIFGIKRSQIKSKAFVEPKYQMFDSDSIEVLFKSGNLHHKVESSSKSLFITSHFSQAILEALKALETVIREISGLNFAGQDLINKAFIGNEPKIKLTPMNDIAERDEQEGFRFIFMGVMRGIRNPIAHKCTNWSDPSLALKYLCMISLLFEKLDNRIFPK